MPFKYTINNQTTVGVLSVIPKRHHETALLQKENTISTKQKGWFSPPTIIGVGETIIYEIEEDEEEEEEEEKLCGCFLI